MIQFCLVSIDKSDNIPHQGTYIVSWDSWFILKHKLNTNRTGQISKRKGVTDASLNNPENFRTGKCKKKHTGHLSDTLTGEKICLLHGTRHFTEDFKLLREYSENYSVHQPHNQYHSSSKENHGKIVHFKSSKQYMNIIIKKAVFTVLKKV